MLSVLNLALYFSIIKGSKSDASMIPAKGIVIGPEEYASVSTKRTLLDPTSPPLI